MTSLVLKNQTAVAASNWDQIPPLGNIEAYIGAVKKIPMLRLEEEQTLAYTLLADGSGKTGMAAAQKLVLAHLKLVVATARQYLGYGLPHADLIQEGNIGLLKAVRNYDPTQGVRLASYALHWIKAEMHEYILKNWRLVKVATTKAQRKLFFNLRSLKNELRLGQNAETAGQTVRDLTAVQAKGGSAELDEIYESHHSALRESEVEAIAKRLNVKPEEVREMNQRLYGADIALESERDDEEDSFAPIHYLTDTQHEPVTVIERNQRDEMAHDGVAHALQQLDERSRRIVSERWLAVNDDGSGGMTLHELAAEYGISAERVRQIETAAMKKMRTVLEKVKEGVVEEVA